MPRVHYGAEIETLLGHLLALFKPSSEPADHANRIRTAWYNSTGFQTAGARDALSDIDRVKLSEWLTGKIAALETSIREGRALASDVLVLGILPINMQVVLNHLHVSRGKDKTSSVAIERHFILSSARTAIASYRLEHFRQIEMEIGFLLEACHRVAEPLLHTQELYHHEDDVKQVRQWQADVQHAFDPQRLSLLHPVLRGGLVELLKRLKSCIEAHLKSGTKDAVYQAFKLFVRVLLPSALGRNQTDDVSADELYKVLWSPEKIMSRIEQTRDLLRGVSHAAELHWDSPSTHPRAQLEVESSNASHFFRCLPLPPAYPDSSTPGASTHAYRQDSSESEKHSYLRTLGAEPRLGRRAALYYGFRSPAEWAARRV